MIYTGMNAGRVLNPASVNPGSDLPYKLYKNQKNYYLRKSAFANLRHRRFASTK